MFAHNTGRTPEVEIRIRHFTDMNWPNTEKIFCDPV